MILCKEPESIFDVSISNKCPLSGLNFFADKLSPSRAGIRLESNNTRQRFWRSFHHSGSVLDCCNSASIFSRRLLNRLAMPLCLMESINADLSVNLNLLMLKLIFEQFVHIKKTQTPARRAPKTEAKEEISFCFHMNLITYSILH